MANPTPFADLAATPEQALFQTNWQIYHKIVAGNHLFHREAYATLAQVLKTRAPQPFRFLDIACGDGSASLTALQGQAISSYCGMDLSRPALAMAAQAVQDLDCPTELIEGDFTLLLAQRREPADVAWIGLSLHHLLTPAKRRAIRAIRKLVPQDGLFMIYEFARQEGEDRDAWLRRWSDQRRGWTEFSPEEHTAVAEHFATADFPETAATWQALGRDAGFATMAVPYTSPSDLLRLYCFS